MQKRTKAAWADWQGLIREQEISGKSVTLFCTERNLRASQFCAWRRRLREGAGNGFVEVAVLKTEPVYKRTHQPTTLRAERTAVGGSCGSDSSGMEVRLRGGRSVVVMLDFEAHHLRAVVAALEEIPEARGTAWA